MRFWLVALLLVTFVPMVPAQTAAPLGEDPAGDVASQAGVPLLPDLKEIDLRAFAVREDAKGFTFDIVVDGLAPEAAPGIVLANWIVHFEHNGQMFELWMQRSNLVGTTDFYARLGQFDAGRGGYVPIAYPEAEASFTENTISVPIERGMLRDANGTAPAPGRVLDQFEVSSYANNVNTMLVINDIEPPAVHYEDHLPDDGVLSTAHQVQFGVAGTGNLALAAEEPFRASNGEATTFVYYVDAINEGSEADRVHFEATGFPSQWEITLPADMDLGPGSTTEVPVIVRTAFAHSHGTTASFILSMKSSGGGGVGRIEMGVYYPLIPQPAGHHDTLYIHTLDYSNDPAMLVLGTALGTVFSSTGLLQDTYMNTLEDDDRADEVPADGQKCRIITLDDDYPVGTGYCWDIPLDPGLVLGLDFDLSRVGHIIASFNSLAPLPGASMEGRLIYESPPEDSICNPFCGGRELTELALINRTPLVDLLTGGDHTFDADITPLAGADLIPYVNGGSMTLELRLSTLRPDTWIYGPPLPPPSLLPGASMILPLNEYADPVQGVIDFGSMGIALSPVGQQERAVNPGDTVVFRASLQNRGNATDVSLNVIGSHREWVTILGSTEISLAEGENKTVAIAVTPTTDAHHGDMADLVLQASNLNDISQRSLVRFVAHVDTEADLEDEAALAEQLTPASAKQSPGPGPLLVLTLAGLALRRRR